MSWTQAIRSGLGSVAMISMAGGVLLTGSLVLYKDMSRYPRMQRAYERGKVLSPLSENDCEVTYFDRPMLQDKIREILNPKSLTNEYYLITGEAGSGKTRTVVEIVRKMIDESGSKCEGAPIYVLSAQGKSFPETLAKTVDFHFDEHVKFSFFPYYIIGIHSFPSRDDNNKFVRVLAAIEKSAFFYMKEHERPIVLVFDGVDSLNSYIPGALERLQEKAKLWADANVAKVIFICNDEETESLFQRNPSNWSRAGAPIAFDDLTKEEAIQFLRVPLFMENSKDEHVSMPMERAEEIFSLVGGHIHYLIICKRAWISGKPFEETEHDLKMREKEKFVDVSRRPVQWIAVSKLREAEKKTMLLSKLIKETSEEAVEALAKKNIIRYRRKRSGTTVHFQTRLTENVVEEFQKYYDLGSLLIQALEVQPQTEVTPEERAEPI